MQQQRGQRLRRDASAIYRIRLEGSLNADWFGYLSDLSISLVYTEDGAPVTILHGEVADQAELMGVLNNVYDLGYPLLSVECLDG